MTQPTQVAPVAGVCRATGQVATTEASRYMTRLCYHFSRKITVRYDEHHTEAEFPWGHCSMQATDAQLRFDCTAPDAASLARVRYAIDEHVKLFSRKNPLVVQWDGSTGA